VRKNGNKKEAAPQLFINFKKACVLFSYNVLIEFGIPLKLARLINMWLNETCSKVKVAKHVSDMFPIKGEVFHICFRVGH
jgi:hypothetical protein